MLQADFSLKNGADKNAAYRLHIYDDARPEISLVCEINKTESYGGVNWETLFPYQSGHLFFTSQDTIEIDAALPRENV